MVRDSAPLHAGGQRLYYRSYKAEAAGHKALVTLVFHHGYGCYCGFYDRGMQIEWRKNVEESFEWPLYVSEHCISHEYSSAKPLFTSCKKTSMPRRLQDTAEEGLQRIRV